MSRRTARLATLTLAMTAVSAVLSQASLAAPPAPAVLEGTYLDIAAEARPGVKAEHDRPVVRTANGQVTSLAKKLSVPSGSKVKVKGKKASTGSFEATSTELVAAAPRIKTPTEPTDPTTTPVVTGPVAPAQLATSPAARQRVLVVLATWTQPDAVTPDSARDAFFSNADEWYTQATHGALGMTGDVTPWLTIAGPDAGLCWVNMFQYLDQAKAAARAAGYDPAGYDRTVLYFPGAPAGSDCYGYAGWATQPGSDVWLNGTLDMRTVVHEQGHNLGLGHSFAWSCTDAAGLPVSTGLACSALDYADPTDAMGSSGYVGFFAAPQLVRQGWLGTDRIAALGSGSSTVLQPLESAVGVAAATVTAGTRTYWLEYRTGAGRDSGIPAGSKGGALVRLADGSRPEAGLLDMTPADGNLDTAVLAGGTSWVTPEGHKLTVGTDTGSGLPVSVSAVTVPTAPTSLALRLKGGRLTVTWAAPASDGGSPLTGYALEVAGAHLDLAPGTTSWTSGTLPVGVITVAVAATNAVGDGPSTLGSALR